METKRMDPNIDARLFHLMVSGHDTKARRAGFQFHPRYVRMLASHVKHKLGEYAYEWEDVLQDVLKASYEHRERAPLAGLEFRRWIYSIVRTICFNIVTRTHEVEPLPLIDPKCAQAGPDMETLLAEQTALIRAAVDELPLNLAELIRLHYLEEESVQEIAPKVGLETRVVRMHLEKAREGLRWKLAPLSETGGSPQKSKRKSHGKRKACAAVAP